MDVGTYVAVCVAALIAAPIVPSDVLPAPLKYAYVSAASTAYAIAVKGFKAMWFEGDSSLLTTLLDVSIVAGCIPASYYGSVAVPQAEVDLGNGLGKLNVAAYLSSLISLYLARRIYLRLIVGNKFKPTRVDDRVYIVTGSNTGLGYETSREIVNMGGRVVMACRTVDKANAARETLLRETRCKPEQLLVLHLDLNSFASVNAFVKEFKSLKLPLHCLVNNAGLMMSDRNVTQDGLEMVFTANHLSAFLLTSLLIPLLAEGAKTYKCLGRVVNVSSSLHKIPRSFNFDDVMSERSYSLFSTYAQSKLANILFTFELERYFQSKKLPITSNCLHPGFVRTEVTRHMNPFLRIGNDLATPIMLTLQKTPPQGAYCSIHVSTSPEIEGVGGKYFANCRVVGASGGAKSQEDAQRLWVLSEKLTGAKWP